MTGFLLDTHVWLWVQRNEPSEVSAGFFPEIERWQQQQRAFVSIMSAWELARLQVAKRLDLGLHITDFVREATVDGGLQLLAMDTSILIDSTQLPGSLHRDPADRVLVATARHHGLTLVTRDKPLLKYAAQGYVNARKP